MQYGEGQHTITARLDGSFNVANALDGHAVLVVAVDILVLELANLVNQHAKLVRDIRDVVIASLAPDGELLLQNMLARTLRY